MFYYNTFNIVLKKDHLVSQKYQNIILFIVIANKNIKPNNKSFFSLISNHHLCNSFLPIAILVLNII